MNESECTRLIESVEWTEPKNLISLAVLGFIDILVIVGNCLVIAAVFCSHKLRSVTNFFIGKFWVSLWTISRCVSLMWFLVFRLKITCWHCWRTFKWYWKNLGVDFLFTILVSLAVADLLVGLAVLPFSATWEVFKVNYKTCILSLQKKDYFEKS